MVPLAVGQNIGDVLKVVDCDDVALVSDVTYVDDLCLMVSAEKPDELIERSAEMIRVCRRALAKHGLQMNFSKDIIECVMRLLGRGSQEFVAGLQCIDGRKVITVDGAVVRIVRSYKHLGARWRDESLALRSCHSRPNCGWQTRCCGPSFSSLRGAGVRARRHAGAA